MTIFYSYSEFCGHPVCKICIVKTRPFPGHQLQKELSQELASNSQANQGIQQEDSKTSSSLHRGHICRVCDRKFYIKELFKASRVITEEQSQEIMQLRR